MMRSRTKSSRSGALRHRAPDAKGGDPALRTIVSEACRRLGSPHGAVVAREQDAFRIVAGKGMGARMVGKIVPPGLGALREPVRSSRAVTVSDHRRLPGATALRSADPLALATAPIMVDRRLEGCVCVLRPAPTRYTPAERRALEGIALDAAVVLLAARGSPRRPPPGKDPTGTSALLRIVYDAIGCGVVVRDTSGRIQHVNEAAERIFGVSAAEVLGRTSMPIHRRLAPDRSELPDAQRAWKVALATRTPVRGRTIGVRLEDGSERWFLTDAVPVLDPAGAPMFVVSSFIDITARTHAEADAERRRTEAEALAAAARVVAAGTAAGATLQGILDASVRVVSARAAFLLLPRDGGKTLEIAAVAGQLEGRLPRVPITRGVTGRAFRTGTVQVVPNVDADPDYVVGARSIRSELAVPILSGGAVIGVLSLEDDELARFGDREARLMETFAAHAAAALEQDRLLADARDRAADLAATNAELVASRVRLDAVVQNAPVILYSYDQQGIATMAEGAGLAAFGLAPADVVGKRITDLFPGLPIVAENVRRVLSGEAVAGTVDLGPVVLETKSVPRRDERGEVTGATGVAIDVTERSRAEAQLRLLRSAVEHANDAVVITDSQLERPGPRIAYVNSAYTRMTGRSAEEAIGASPRISQGPRTDPAFNARLRQALERGDPFRGETLNYRKDGTEYAVELHITPIRSAEGAVTHFVSVQRDVTEQQRTQQELERLALHDPLTGLPNRSLLHDRLEQSILSAKREDTSFALLLADLDRFKEVNDTFGHQVGDALLREVGARIRREIREADTVSRLGGDEFAVILDTATAEGAERVARKLLHSFDAPFTAERHDIEVGASFGIAVYPRHGDDPDILLRHADIAMYVAKAAAAGIATYEPEQDLHSPARLAMRADLRRTIEKGELVLHFQPIVASKGGRPTSVEALVRWDRVGFGLLMPADFISVAEQSGLIRGLTAWVITEALDRGAAWPAIPVAVNVSPRNLLDPEFPATVERILRTRGSPGSALQIEITESVLMADPERALRALERMQLLGVAVHIDDFGTGYSSLAYLQRLPVDAIKIDRSFVSRMSEDAASATIVRSTVELGHSLGLTVIGEGVENEETYRQLVTLGCDAIQGFHVSAPLPADELVRWLHGR